jgi:hypothetical protein
MSMHEGVARDAFLVDGEYCDALTMSIGAETDPRIGVQEGPLGL